MPIGIILPEEKEMDKLAKFFKERTKGFYFVALGFVFSLISLVLYALTGVNEFAPKYSVVLFVTTACSLALSLFSRIREWKLVREFAYLFAPYSFICYIGTQVNYVANLLVAIDGSSFSMGFLFSVIFFFLAFLADLISVFLSKKPVKDEVKLVTTKEN